MIKGKGQRTKGGRKSQSKGAEGLSPMYVERLLKEPMTSDSSFLTFALGPLTFALMGS
jgi:hypothetical protein